MAGQLHSVGIRRHPVARREDFDQFYEQDRRVRVDFLDVPVLQSLVFSPVASLVDRAAHRRCGAGLAELPTVAIMCLHII